MPRSQAFFDYLERHVRRLGLLAAGRPEDSPEVVRLEDDMDKPWFRMTEEDVNAFDAVSKALDAVNDERKS